MKDYMIGLIVTAILSCGTVTAQEQPVAAQSDGMMPGKQIRQIQPGNEMMNRGGRGMREENRDGGRGCMIEKMLENTELIKEIGVSDEKVAEIKAKIIDISKQQVELEAKQKLAAIEQAELMKAEKLDEKAIMSAVEKSGTIHTEIAKLRISKMVLLKNALTPEQIKKAREIFMKKMKERGESGQMTQPGQEGFQRPFMREKLKQKMNKQGTESGKQQNRKDKDDKGDDNDKTPTPPTTHQ